MANVKTLKNLLNRIFILNRRNLSLEFKLMQREHQGLLSQGFYTKLAETIDLISCRLRLSIDENAPTKLFASISNSDFLLAYYQRLFSATLGNHDFRKAILYSLTFDVPIWFPLKKTWQEDLSGLGLKFNQPICSTLIWMFQVHSSLRAIARLLISEWDFWKRLVGRNQFLIETSADQKSILLSGFSRGNFPSLHYPSHNFFDWVSDYYREEINFIHDNEELAREGHLRENLHFKKFFGLRSSWMNLLHSYLSLTVFLINIPKSRRVGFGKIFYLVDEVMISIKIFECQKSLSLSHALFPSTYMVVKPLWATQMERQGIEVVCVSYTAFADPLNDSNNRIVNGVWHLSNWKVMWVVDQTQINQMMMTSMKTSEKFITIGVPYWSGKIYVPPKELAGPFVSIFDTYIREDFFGAGTMEAMGWHNPALEIIFLETILQVASELGLTVLHKKKRQISKELDLVFEEKIKETKMRYSQIYHQIEPNYSADSIIEHSSVVVSKPLSTTAFIASQLNIPSLFFDPTGKVKVDDLGLRKCGLAHNHTDLKLLIQKALNLS
jgi:polysaccharide biosynthesis PFTS motif protein